MRRNRRPSAFTLIESLIVIIIMAILAATVIPQFAESTKDAKLSALEYDLHMLRSQIEAYKLQHLNEAPAALAFVVQMTQSTNAQGLLDPGNDPYGPYMHEIPPNPFTDTDTIVSVDLGGAPATGTDVTAAGGWLYDENTGDIWPNNSEYYE